MRPRIPEALLSETEMLRRDEANRCAALLDSLAALVPGNAAGAVVRHADREPILDFARSEEARLTPIGRAAAHSLGQRLPAGRRLRLIHSPVHRCAETAEQLAAGYQSWGGEAIVEGEDRRLLGPYVLDGRELGRLVEQQGMEPFIRCWFDGGVSPSVLQPLADAAAELLAAVAEHLERAAPDELWFLVTHDWNLLLLREHYLGVRHEDAGWPDYLDGCGLWRRDGQLSLGWRGRWVIPTLSRAR